MKYSIKLCLAGLLALTFPGTGLAAECWQGWGYWVDAQTRTYTSQELLLVTDGPAEWVHGQAVTLRLLERASGLIDETKAPIVAVVQQPRAYYRGSANYVDGTAHVQGAADNLVFGLSHIVPSTPGLARMEAYTKWVCGLGRD